MPICVGAAACLLVLLLLSPPAEGEELFKLPWLEASAPASVSVVPVRFEGSLPDPPAPPAEELVLTEPIAPEWNGDDGARALRLETLEFLERQRCSLEREQAGLLAAEASVAEMLAEIEGETTLLRLEERDPIHLWGETKLAELKVARDEASEKYAAGSPWLRRAEALVTALQGRIEGLDQMSESARMIGPLPVESYLREREAEIRLRLAVVTEELAIVERQCVDLLIRFDDGELLLPPIEDDDGELVLRVN